ncbi:hypothetical protein A2U01_0073760, partial [Trifolium medium]|nr:hypothetical protein [Trifolium medium]
GLDHSAHACIAELPSKAVDLHQTAKNVYLNISSRLSD